VEGHDQIDFEDFAKETGGGTSKKERWLKDSRLEPTGLSDSSRVYGIGVQPAHAGTALHLRVGNMIPVRR